MDLDVFDLAIYAVPLSVIMGIYCVWQWRTSTVAKRRLRGAIAAGLAEPVSLHPVIDPTKCLGCGACVSACPEGDVLGLIHRKAELVAPGECIGHGACRAACPTHAISLVFGSAIRGVDIPLLSPEFETSVPGIYIAGELGGMGLIKNAITQGRQAVAAIAAARAPGHGFELDLLIVGAGPAGLAAALEAKARQLSFAIVEQDTVGGTLAHYPRGKLVMTQPAELPIVGPFQFREASKERLIAFWESVIHKAGLQVRTGVRVEQVTPIEGGFSAATTGGEIRAHKVLLALGRRGTPRKLDVPGEDLAKVVYRLIDPEQYAGKKVLVVGGGDTALEAALALAREAGTEVTLSHRGKNFNRAKPANRERIEKARLTGRINVRTGTQVGVIKPTSVVLEGLQGDSEIANDAVIICVGGLLPTPFLHQAGIEVEAKYGTA